MTIEEELASVSPTKDMLLTIGFFDGVHVGHKYLISQLKEQSLRQNLLSGIVTFRQHPNEVLHHKTELLFLTDFSQKINLLKNEGVDYVIALSFTPELAQLSARQFVGLLQKYLRMRGMVIGYDFTMGKNKEGDYDMLCTLGQKMNFSVTKASCHKIGGEIVSSTAIRKALSEGDKQTAFNMLGWQSELGFSLSYPQ